MKITTKDATKIAKKLNINLETIPIDTWKYALHVESEHGKKFGKITNITNDNLLLTGQIATAHLLEFPDYYDRLCDLESDAEKYWKNKSKPDIFNQSEKTSKKGSKESSKKITKKTMKKGSKESSRKTPKKIMKKGSKK